ncbi:hypothetical protein BFP70_13700 [Thioclava sp. SK-1]|nr:hypothetical protein BFP70_13700 [Thioclava sp. SK-1]
MDGPPAGWPGADRQPRETGQRPAQHRGIRRGWLFDHGLARDRHRLAMAGTDTLLVTVLQNRMARDQRPILEDSHLGRVVLDFDELAPGRIRNAVLVAASSDHALLADTALHDQDRLVGSGRKCHEVRPLFGKVLVNDPSAWWHESELERAFENSRKRVQKGYEKDLGAARGG